VRFSDWELRVVRLGGVWRYRIGSPRWSPLRPGEIGELMKGEGQSFSPLRGNPIR
jgi:hypothetical protein